MGGFRRPDWLETSSRSDTGARSTGLLRVAEARHGGGGAEHSGRHGCLRGGRQNRILPRLLGADGRMFQAIRPRWCAVAGTSSRTWKPAFSIYGRLQLLIRPAAVGIHLPDPSVSDPRWTRSTSPL